MSAPLEDTSKIEASHIKDRDERSGDKKTESRRDSSRIPSKPLVPNDRKSGGRNYSHDFRNDMSPGGSSGRKRYGGYTRHDDSSSSHPTHRSTSGQHHDYPKPSRSGENDYQEDTDESSDKKQKKFPARCRLFIGNIPTDMTDTELRTMCTKHGQVGEVFVNAHRGFAFVRLDQRSHADDCKREMDGMVLRGKTLRVRFASHGAAIKVRNLSEYVTNELLEEAFSMFGKVERAVVAVDDRGRSAGYGIVEFERKPVAMQCLTKCSDGCFLLTAELKPVIVEPLQQLDEEDGLPEKAISKSDAYYRARSNPPRFITLGTFEHSVCLKWLDLEEQRRQMEQQVKDRIQLAKQQLDLDIEQAAMDHQTLVMREELARRQDELRHLEEKRKTDLEKRKSAMMMMMQHQQRGSPLGLPPGNQPHMRFPLPNNPVNVTSASNAAISQLMMLNAGAFSQQQHHNLASGQNPNLPFPNNPQVSLDCPGHGLPQNLPSRTSSFPPHETNINRGAASHGYHQTNEHSSGKATAAADIAAGLHMLLPGMSPLGARGIPGPAGQIAHHLMSMQPPPNSGAGPMPPSSIQSPLPSSNPPFSGQPLRPQSMADLGPERPSRNPNPINPNAAGRNQPPFQHSPGSSQDSARKRGRY